MTGGITQPGGTGTVIYVENNYNADALLGDGQQSYVPSDIIAKALASGDFVDTGLTTGGSPISKVYDAKSSIQNGDGAGTMPTKFWMVGMTLQFRSARTYLVSTVGAATRETFFGQKIGTGLRCSGNAGVRLIAGASAVALTFNGNTYIYDSYIAGHNGIGIKPAVDGVGELVQSIFECFAGIIQYIGQSGFALANVFNCTFIQPTSALNTWINVNVMENVTFANYPTGGAYALRVAGGLNGRKITFINNHAAPTGDLYTSTLATKFTLTDTTWSQRCRKVQNVVADSSVSDRYTFGVGVTNISGTPVAGVAVELFDHTAQTVLDVVTDANGEIHWATGIPSEDDSVLVESYNTGVNPTPIYWGPFKLKVNHKSPSNGSLPAFEQTFDWPGTVFADGTQYRPLHMPVTLAYPVVPLAASFTRSPGGGTAPLTETFTNTTTDYDAPTVRWKWTFGDGVGVAYEGTGITTLGDPVLYVDTGGCLNLLPGQEIVGFQASTQDTSAIPPGTVVVSVEDDYHITMSNPATSDTYLAPLYFFNGGLEAITASPVHVYNTPGLYEVTLLVWDYNGSSSFSMPSAVFVPQPCEWGDRTISLIGVNAIMCVGTCSVPGQGGGGGGESVTLPLIGVSAAARAGTAGTRNQTSTPNRIMSQYVRERLHDETGREL